METDKLSNLFIELQDILAELVNQSVAEMSDEEIQRIKEKYGKREIKN